MSGRKQADVANQRNEYIPTFISRKPFYIKDESTTTTTDTDYLEHQRLHKGSDEDHEQWYNRGKKLGPAATKYRRGACENCGALSHKTKECLNRPRKIGAKWTGRDIQPDEAVERVELGWAAKRDRWNGYDSREFSTTIAEFEDLNTLKKEAKLLETESNSKSGGGRLDDDTEEAKYAEESDMGREQNASTRNLRLREDTAKYLLNLDLDSAKYDPKTRSMVDMGGQVDEAAELVAEDNCLRSSGDAAEFEKAKKYAWELQEHGVKEHVHLQANPTSGELRHKLDEDRKSRTRDLKFKALVDVYGAQSSRSIDIAVEPPLENGMFFEYNETGTIVNSDPQDTSSTSKYVEDRHPNNHSSVWGSWWNNFQWGYACCHSTTKNSYCTGEVGKRALEEATNSRLGGLLAQTEKHEVGKTDNEKHKIGKTDKNRAIKPLQKRTFAELQYGVDEREFDEYRKRKAFAEDPMSKFATTT